MLPLKITASLAAPIVGDPSVPIDGVLYYTAMRERYGPQAFTEPGQDHVVRVAAVSLPLKRHNEHTPQWYYAASFAQWPRNSASGMAHWNKRIGPIKLGQFTEDQAGKVDINSGRYKAYRMPVWYRHADEICWYVVGDPLWIHRTLGFCTHLGKKTDQGWGHVSRWRIEEVAEDWSVTGPTGQLVRAIPSTSGPLRGFRPSYWLRKNQAPCTMPAEQ